MLMQFLKFEQNRRHLEDRVVAALGRAAVAGDARRRDFDLHSAAVPAVDIQTRRLGNHDKLRLDLVLFDDVLPTKPVAVFFLDRAGDQ